MLPLNDESLQVEIFSYLDAFVNSDAVCIMHNANMQICLRAACMPIIGGESGSTIKETSCQPGLATRVSN